MKSLQAAVKIAVDLLSRGEYEALENLTRGVRLSAREMEDAVDRYGRTLKALPPDWWESVEVTEVESSGPARFHVAVPLHTREEGRSDLTAELEAAETVQGVFQLGLEDIHVL